ncbi:MAG: cytochrome C oxidase subunit II [Treponema sp.]|jgi:hypothetical protein|nr:cytochrome C oxidase subunit II [Treponema sp.]
MGTVNLSKRPNAVYARKSAADIRNVPQTAPFAAALVLEEETGTMLHYLKGKLPAEVFERLSGKGGLKEKVYDAINRHYQEMFGRYTASDDKDETAAFIYHTAGEIAELLRSGGEAGQFNTGEIETSAGRNLNDLEDHANNLLRHDAGAFLPEESPGLIVKCVFRDNAQRPKTVTDLKLSINVPDTLLISPIFYCHAAAKYLIKDLIPRHIIESIDRTIDACADKELEERITGLLAEIVPPGLNMANVREHVRKSADIETIRTRGFSTAVNLLVALLDHANMGYQFIENAHNGRELIIREYEDNDEVHLPDERYQIRLWYLDRDRLAEDCKIYETQVRNFENDVQHLWDLMEVTYQDSKSVFKVNDFEDLAKKNKSRIRDMIKKKKGEALYEISGETLVEKDSRPGDIRRGDFRHGDTRRALARMHERIKNMCEFLYPAERRIMEERLARLEKEYYRFDCMVNPRHLQPGLLIDVDLTSIKRKKTTLGSLAYTLNEFLRRVSIGFHDAALAVFDSHPPAAVQSKSGEKKLKTKVVPKR